jgi:hypothetical protein
MANCLAGITADVLNTCSEAPIGGLELNAWVFNRADVTATISATNKNLVTDIAVASGKKGYKIQGFKKNVNAGHDIVVSETNIDKYNHYFNFQAWMLDSVAVNNLDGLSDLVVVVERLNKMKAGDGAFKVYGLETGLYKSADTERSNDIDGNRNIEMTNQAGEESTVSAHIYFETSYAVTKAALDALLVIQT